MNRTAIRVLAVAVASLLPLGAAMAAGPGAAQRRAFVCNYEAAERHYEGRAEARLVKRCLRRSAKYRRKRS